MKAKVPKEKKRTAAGYCNLCNQLRDLTFDHIPPKGSIELKPVEIKNFINSLEEGVNGRVNIYSESHLKDRVNQRRISQNGIKFKTICADCNNALLGARYDPEIKRISSAVGKLVRARFITGLSLPSTLKVHVKTHSLMRGIIGHLLAAHQSKDQTQPLPGSEEGFHKDLREYFLNEDYPLPPSVQIYYWTYPFYDQVIVNSLAIVAKKGEAYAFGDLIKFFPLAYFVAQRREGNLELDAPKLFGNNCSDTDCVVALEISLDTVPPNNWPETPDAIHHTVMPWELSVIAKARK